MLGFLVEEICKYAQKVEQTNLWLNSAKGVWERHELSALCRSTVPDLINAQVQQTMETFGPYDASKEVLSSVEDRFGPVTEGTIALASHV